MLVLAIAQAALAGLIALVGAFADGGDIWPVLLAGSVIGSAPLIVIFLICQKFLIGGITLSGLKG